MIATGAPFGPILLFIAVFSLLFAYRFPYFTFYAMASLMPFLGVTIAIPTGTFTFGERAFGGSIDIGVAEAILLALIVAWALKIIILWIGRRDRAWKPEFPLGIPYLGIVAAHLMSLASPFSPDPLQVIKYTARPVFLSYLGYVALPVNVIRSKRRLKALLGVMAGVGTIGAVNGALSLLFVDASSQFIRRAHPLPVFGVPILGDNHNLLAELMVVTVMLTAALFYLVRSDQWRRVLAGSAALQFAVGILTFSRTGWICFAVQAAFLAAIEFRHTVRRHARAIAIGILLLVPFAGYMALLSVSRVATSSNETRIALAEIAWDVFRSSPVVGAGAGTFVEIVGSAYIFRLEFGDPLDSHGILQKLGAETGILGLAAFGALVVIFARIMMRRIRRLEHAAVRRVTVLLTSAAFGALIYQLFNTNYWTGKMWLPIGIALASIRALKDG